MAGLLGLLSKERIIAQPGFNRWLVPPAALAIHLSIGMAYGSAPTSSSSHWESCFIPRLRSPGAPGR
jgi:hypothetical protein